MVVASPATDRDLSASIEPRERSLFSRAADRLFAPVDIAPIIVFRILFGVMMMLEVGGYTVAGLVRRNWVEPEVHFTYFGWSWVPTMLGNWTYVLIGVCMVAAIGITLGAYYRICAGVFAFGFTWFYLMEQANYMNHFYLICLLAFTAFVLPLERAFSLDARRKPEIRARTVPAWTLLLLQAHMAIGYFFGGIAKMNSDWLRGEPIRTWLHTGSMGEQLGPTFDNEFTVYALSYGGLLFDLLVVPFLIWRRTRMFALGGAIFFHLSNAWLFNIGIFPFLSIMMTLLFLNPGWHRKLLRLDRRGLVTRHQQWGARHLVVPLLAMYFAYHLFMPFRHWLYPGNVHWTEEGHRYAWHMMLRTKRGEAFFVVEDRNKRQVWKVDPKPYLSLRQQRKMSVHPEMLLQMAHFIRERWGSENIAVYAVATVKLNDHKPALLVDPRVDLSREELTMGPSRWILPFGNAVEIPTRFLLAPYAPKR
ncbi:MAG TPA: HTTM domain-containing protein [Verrucomicrobiae bacterium]